MQKMWEEFGELILEKLYGGWKREQQLVEIHLGRNQENIVNFVFHFFIMYL